MGLREFERVARGDLTPEQAAVVIQEQSLRESKPKYVPLLVWRVYWNAWLWWWSH